MPLTEAQIQDVESKLGKLPPSLLQAFHDSVEHLPPELTEQQLQLWIDEGYELAAHSLRSWEPAADYFRIAPHVLLQVDEAGFRDWVHNGRDLAEHASAIASAYFRASPLVLPLLAGAQIREWSFLADKLYKATWKSISLASEFLNLSPVLLEHLTIPEMGRLVRVIESISDRSADLAAACLEAAPNVVSSLNHQERLAFLDFAAAISDNAWPEASLYFQRGPDLIHGITPTERAHYLDLCARVARRLGRQAYSLFAEGTVAFKDVDESYHGRVIDLASGLVGLSPVAAMAFIRSVPLLTDRLDPSSLEAWHAAGFDILRQTLEGGEAYFRMESSKAESMVAGLSARVDLSTVSELLRLYSKALTGANVSVQPVGNLAEKGIGWVSESGPSTEGTAVFLPEHIERFDNKKDNFSVFKVYATHQTAHLEFGSFEFSFRSPGGGVLPMRRHDVEAAQRAEGHLTDKTTWVTDMEHFFDLFAERQMASDLFTVTEDSRIDARVAFEYPGIKRGNRLVQELELVRRPDQRTLPLRGAFVENLIRASLDGEDTIDFPKPLMAQMTRGVATVHALRNPTCTVEDAAEACLILYEIAESIPNLPAEILQDLDWGEIDGDMLSEMEQDAAAGKGAMQEGLEQLPDGEEEDYDSPEQVDFRGDFKPELVQLLMRMRMQETAEQLEDDLSALTEEQIKELLEKSVEVDMMDDGDQLSATISAFLENLEKEAGAPLPDDDQQDGEGMEEPDPGAPPPAPEVKLFYYDEWDFRAFDYKPRWCTVRQKILEEGTDEFYEKTLKQYAGLVNETQRQFEMLKPETFRKLKKLEDGEDIDMDAAIDYIAERRSGHGGIPKIYWRRNKIERDVAVAFLLDMSASTDEEIEKHRPRRDDGSANANDPRRYYQSVAQARNAAMEPPKRIIDLERESLVLLTHAIEVLGDRYGIYGFSGYGRENVEFFVIKDLDEEFNDVIKRRIDKVTPIRSTRMGPAIRHTAFKLDQADARAKILFLVSDGRPQDHGYGRDRTEKDYAIHDTHKALVEAKNLGITPFALTVDKEGHDYLGAMCGDIAYEVLGDIEQMPSRLPALYRRLTV